jgi:hypothetical protein
VAVTGSRRLLVFVHINKTAGTTLRYILRSSYGSRHCDVEPWHGAWSDPPFSSEDLRRVRKLYPRLASIAGHRIAGWVDLDEPGTELRYVTFLREPVALCASRFQYQLEYRRKRGLVFEDWIRNDWVRDAQTQRLGGTTDPTDAIGTIARKQIFVGLTERFDESIVLLKHLRAPDLDIRYAPRNVARGSNVAKRLLDDPTTRRMLVDANRGDLELYRHVIETVFPTQERALGSSLGDRVAEFREGGEVGYRRVRLAMYGLKQRAVLKPTLRLYRGQRAGRVVRSLLG